MRDKNVDIVTYAVSLIIKAVIMASRFSGRARKRSLKRLATMDADTKDKECLFLKDKVYQLEMHPLSYGRYPNLRPGTRQNSDTLVGSHGQVPDVTLGVVVVTDHTGAFRVGPLAPGKFRCRVSLASAPHKELPRLVGLSQEAPSAG